MKNTISLCIIAKNEAGSIARCITSALPYVDQVVVVDTGSSDQTPEIARELGAEVWNFAWNNDFSAARNYSLEKAAGEWILYMDCDEEVEPGSGGILRAAVQTEDYDAYFINVKNILGQGHEVTFHSIRLFRNLPRFSFEGQIHEQISYSIIAHSGRNRIGSINFTLIHHGYNPEQVNINAKIQRNIMLLEEQSKTGREDGFFFYNLGIEYVRQGQFQLALEKFMASLKKSPINCGYAPVLANKTVVCLIELGRYRDALEQLRYFQSLFPRYSDLYLLEAACHIRCGRYSLAAGGIEKAKKVSADNFKYPVEGKIFGRAPEEILDWIKPFQVWKSKRFQITVCILARGEEKNIARCIQSVGELADSVILVTPGCSDHTLATAYQMGAKIYRLKLENSLAKLRNFALQQAAGDWVLFINGNEELNRQDIPGLVGGLNQSRAKAHYVRLRTFYNPNNQLVYQDRANCRIISNEKDFFYSSSLVEDIEQSVQKKYGAAGIGCLPVTVFHYSTGFKSEFRKVDFKRNAALITADFAKIGKNALFYKTMGYEFLKVERYKAAFGHFNRAIKITGFDAPADCWYYAIYCLLKLKRFDEALVLCERARDLYPDYTDIIYLQGCCSLNLGYLQQAAQCYNRCIQMGEAAWEKYTVHSGVGTYLPRCGLAEVYLKQGQITSCLNNYKIAAGYPEAVCRAVPSLTRCIIMNFGPGRVLPYLRDNGLDSCRHLCTAAVETAKSGCLMESLELWQAALDKMKKLNDLSQYPLISSTMFQILGGIYAEAVEHNPNNAHLQAIAPFFKG